jgi:hypothetical protein
VCVCVCVCVSKTYLHSNTRLVFDQKWGTMAKLILLSSLCSEGSHQLWDRHLKLVTIILTSLYKNQEAMGKELGTAYLS